MQAPKGYSVRIFMPEGDATGVRIIGKSHWTGQGTVFTRELAHQALDDELLARAGVYILWGEDDDGGLPHVYVGESGKADERLRTHSSHKDPTSWSKGVVFISTDNSLNKAHALHIEAQLCDLADRAKRCQLQNTQKPRPPTLSDADKADAEAFLSDILLCLPIIEVSFFEKLAARPNKADDLEFKGKGTDAIGYESAGKFVVRKGAIGVGDDDLVDSMPKGANRLRQDLISRSALKANNGAYELMEDFPFNSPSQAAAVLAGASYNGRDHWKNKDGKSLNEIELSRLRSAATD